VDVGKFLLVVLLVAVTVYVVVRLVQRRGGPPGGGRSRPSRPLSPDDDPDFLRDLDLDVKRERPKQEDDPA
jgi:hypothetical protein